MDEVFSGWLGEQRSDLRQVPQMEKRNLSDVPYVGLEGELAVQYHPKITDLTGGDDCDTIHGEAKMFAFVDGGLGANQDNLSFITVQLEKALLHPCSDVSQATCEKGGGDVNGVTSGGNIELRVISVEVKTKSILPDDVAQG